MLVHLKGFLSYDDWFNQAICSVGSQFFYLLTCFVVMGDVVWHTISIHDTFLVQEGQ